MTRFIGLNGCVRLRIEKTSSRVVCSLHHNSKIPDENTTTIQLLGKEDLTLDDAYGSDEKMHASWLASYALTSATEGVGAQVKAPLLKRCVIRDYPDRMSI